MSQPSRTLHDRLFKEFLHRFLPDFLQIFFPEESAHLNLATLQFIDQELMVNNLPQQLLRIADVAAQVETVTGDPETVLVHIEIEGRDKQHIGRRMFEYFALFSMLHNQPVFPIVLLLVPQGQGIAWQVHQQTLFGRELLTFRYAQIAVRDLDGTTYLGQHPVAAALAALMQTGGLSTAELKLNSLRHVVDSDLTMGDKRFLIDLVETYLPHDRVMDARGEIMDALMEMELTWAEKIEQEAELRGQLKGKREGKQEGRQEGKREGTREGLVRGKQALLFRLLRARFGDLSTQFIARLEAVRNPDQLDELSEQILFAESLADIHLPLPTEPPAEEDSLDQS